MMAFTPPREIALRDYQADAIEGLRAGIRAGQRRLILCAGTGAGKTVCAAHLLREADRKGSYALFLVDRVALVDQTSTTLDDYGIRHGVVQGIHRRWAPHENVQVASIQTLARRSLPRQPSLIVYDECHAQYQAALDYIAANPQAVAVGLTATPFTKGMGRHWDGIVNVIPTQHLIDGGHLIAPTMYVARAPEEAELSLSGFGEFTDESAATAGIRIVGDVVEEWLRVTTRHFGGPAKTIVFSPTVAHGAELCEAFAAAGFNFQQVSYKDADDDSRRVKIEEFRRPDSLITGIVSCGVLTKGFDVPDVLVGVSCKPYRKSLSSHMQEIGRIMRPAPGKDRAVWIDHAGNLERFAADMFDVWENGVGNLDKAEKRDAAPRKRDESTRERAVCPECSGALRGDTCTSCGWQRPARSGIVAVAGEVREFQRPKIEARAGLRAECLADPFAVWQGALSYALDHCRDEAKARKWAGGIWHGVYPDARLPRDWWDAPRGTCDPNAYSLAGREVERFRKTRRAA